jgi:hypothetical protein
MFIPDGKKLFWTRGSLPYGIPSAKTAVSRYRTPSSTPTVSSGRQVVWCVTCHDRSFYFLKKTRIFSMCMPYPPRSHMYKCTSVLTAQPGRLWLPLRNWHIYVSMTVEMSFLSAPSPSPPSSFTYLHVCVQVYRFSQHTSSDSTYLCEFDTSKCVRE